MDATAKRMATDALAFAKQTIRHEAAALTELAEQLDASFVLALESIEQCRGSVLITGMGKAGLIGQKISATLCSTGTRSFFLHPAEAIHGDLGRVTQEDIVVVLSMSGETEELTRLIPSLRSMASGLIAITSHSKSTLARQSDIVLELGSLQEADAIGLAPSTSTSAMLAVGDALALTLSYRRGFRSQDFVKFHPGGSLGRKLATVSEFMRPLEECRVARTNQTVRETFVTLRRQGRRTGAVMIVNEEQKLAGLFTDSDLARLLEAESDQSLNVAVGTVMTCEPYTVKQHSRMPEAIRMLAEHQISELPVVDDLGRPLGLIDITDLIGWLPSTDDKPSAPKLLRFPTPTEQTER